MKDKIGIFDSGIGGVTVLQEILKVLPNENYLYYSDSKNNPYGEKNLQELTKLCDSIVKELIDKSCIAIVIACNTASAKVADFLRKKYTNTPIIAIEPAYKMVYDYSYDKPTLIMATQGTIESEKFNQLYHQYDNHKTYLLPCVGLADKIEQGKQEEIQKYLQEKILPYRGKVDNVVLGCTHYPLIQKEIKEVLGNQITLYNGAKGVAINLKKILKKKDLFHPEKQVGKIEFIDSSGLSEKKERFFSYLDGYCQNAKVMI